MITQQNEKELIKLTYNIEILERSINPNKQAKHLTKNNFILGYTVQKLMQRKEAY